MTPSLEALVKEEYPNDPLATVEDMSCSTRIIKPGVKFGPYDLGGKTAQLKVIDPENDTHLAFVEIQKGSDPLVIEFANDDDVYEE